MVYRRAILVVVRGVYKGAVVATVHPVYGRDGMAQVLPEPPRSAEVVPGVLDAGVLLVKPDEKIFQAALEALVRHTSTQLYSPKKHEGLALCV